MHNLKNLLLCNLHNLNNNLIFFFCFCCFFFSFVTSFFSSAVQKRKRKKRKKKEEKPKQIPWLAYFPNGHVEIQLPPYNTLIIHSNDVFVFKIILERKRKKEGKEDAIRDLNCKMCNFEMNLQNRLHNLNHNLFMIRERNNEIKVSSKGIVWFVSNGILFLLHKPWQILEALMNVFAFEHCWEQVFPSKTNPDSQLKHPFDVPSLHVAHSSAQPIFIFHLACLSLNSKLKRKGNKYEI